MSLPGMEHRHLNHSRRAAPGIKPSKRLAESNQDIWATSMALNSAAGVRIGLEFDSGNPRLTQRIQESAADKGRTLHAQALDIALGHLAARNYWGAKNTRFVCQAFLAAKMPVAAVGADNFAVDAFVSSDVESDFGMELKDLFDMYAQAGYIEPEIRLTGHAASKNFEGMLPLTGALLSGNRTLALCLVGLGADTRAVGADVGRPELGAVDVARMGGPKVADRNSVVAAQARADAEAFASELAEAVMARTIAQAPAACDPSEGLAPRRRRASV